MDQITAYIGTYTNGDSKGIYKLALNPVTGEIKDVSLAGELENPTYLTIDSREGIMYSVVKVGDTGGVASLKIDHHSGKLSLINHQTQKGNPPCHVITDGNGKYVFSSNFHMCNAQVMEVSEKGFLKEPIFIYHEGSGPNKVRQEKPHVHYAGLTPDEKYLCVVDLGIDKTVIYSFNNGSLEKHSEIVLKPGSGPRHMVFHPNQRFAYINTELSGEILMLEYHWEKGLFKELGYISTLPKDFTKDNLGSAIHITPDGQFLYAANRGHDSIATYKIDQGTGLLTFLTHTSTEGQNPRDFGIDPSGSFIIAANQSSNNLVPFKIDRDSGKLSRVGNIVELPTPVCVKFL